VSDGWRMSSENELVGHAEVSDDRERHPKSKIGNYQKRGFESKIPERKFE
jgi:hypothetical protein